VKLLLVVLCAVPLLAWLAACGSTRVTTIWRSPEPIPQQPFTKVLALVINATPGERRAAEDTLAAAIRTAQGVPAYTIIPDQPLPDRDKIRQVLLKEAIDGAAVIRLVSSERRIESHTPLPAYPSGGLYDSYEEYQLYRADSIYYTADTYIHAEVSVYSVNDDRLLWSGSSTTRNPTDVRSLVADVSRATAAELQRIRSPGP
jgi:hypothetical protein